MGDAAEHRPSRGARPPDPPSADPAGRLAAGPSPPGSGAAPDALGELLASIASPIGVAVLASLSRDGGRGPAGVASLLNMDAGVAAEHLARFERCGAVRRSGDGSSFELTERVEVRTGGEELELVLQSEDGARITAHLPMGTPTGRLLARVLGGGGDVMR